MARPDESETACLYHGREPTRTKTMPVVLLVDVCQEAM